MRLQTFLKIVSLNLTSRLNVPITITNVSNSVIIFSASHSTPMTSSAKICSNCCFDARFLLSEQLMPCANSY